MGLYSVYIHIFPNQKVYIGITKQEVKKRWKLGEGYKGQDYVYKAIKKYGWANIEHKILYTNLSKEEAEQKEIELIKEYKSNKREYGYNLTEGGSCPEFTEEVRRKISESRKGIVFSDEHIKNLSLSHKGFRPSEETIELNILHGYRRKPVVCIETGRVFVSVRDAGRKLGISHKHISAVCRGERKSAYGLHWKFLNDKGEIKMGKLYSNEIVFKNHPDKICDRISDAILDAYLKQDPMTRAGIETMGGKGYIFVTGEVTSNSEVDITPIVKKILSDAGLDVNKYEVVNNIGTQSPDIAEGVDKSIEGKAGIMSEEKAIGAGDQGMMFGYACNETEKLVPKAMAILQELSKEYEKLRKICPEDIYSDGKAQITGYYDDDFRLTKIKTFTISYQNSEKNREVTDRLVREAALTICNKYSVDVEEFLINPTGKFLVGSIAADSGLTGRKIVVDSYQSFAPVGGGAFSGKDPTKVDRSAAYKARQLAIRALKENDLKWCEIQLSYAIGQSKPLAIYIDSDKGNLEVPDSWYDECTPYNIIEEFDLRKPIYEQTACFGHFGNDFAWEV